VTDKTLTVHVSKTPRFSHANIKTLYDKVSFNSVNAGCDGLDVILRYFTRSRVVVDSSLAQRTYDSYATPKIIKSILEFSNKVSLSIKQKRNGQVMSVTFHLRKYCPHFNEIWIEGP
jgi:hypothetical protein